VTGPHPELEPDPFDDDGPTPGQRRRRVLRIVVLVALGALVLPLVLSAYGVAKSAADRACAVFVAAYDTNAAGFRTTFDLFAPGGAGWECFAISENGTSRLLGNLGPLPAIPRPPDLDEPEEREARAQSAGALNRVMVSTGFAGSAAAVAVGSASPTAANTRL
jgi:ferric-dicitrate binding protein FerR (iron transport regulator)